MGLVSQELIDASVTQESIGVTPDLQLVCKLIGRLSRAGRCRFLFGRDGVAQASSTATVHSSCGPTDPPSFSKAL